MNTNPWIKRSEREPTEADMPGQFGYYTPSGEWSRWTDEALPGKHNLYTHWRSIKADQPPRELTQRERDEQWVEGNPWPHSTRAGSMLKAIYAERREVAKLLEEIMRNSTWGTNNAWEPYHRQLRARLNEQVQGK